MTAKKCDRCGKFYDPYTFDSSESYRYDVIKDCHPYPNTIKIDLCLTCKSELVKWLNEGKK